MRRLRADNLLIVLSMAILPLSSEWAFAQSVPGADPNFFSNNPHPAMPWHSPWALSNQGLVLREIEVPSRSVVIPMEVVQPGSLPSTIEWQEVTLPGYRVTEKVNGFTVQGHWEVRPHGSAYYWTWVPTHFRSK